MVFSPETIFLNNVVDKLYLTCLKQPKNFIYGNIIFIKNKFINRYDFDAIFNSKPKRTSDYIGPVGFGSICCLKKNFENVGY